MMHDTMSAVVAASQLDVVAQGLATVSDRLLDAAARARGLSAATDWQSEAGRAFHAKAEEWAGEVSGLVCLAETARVEAWRARDAALLTRDGGR